MHAQYSLLLFYFLHYSLSVVGNRSTNVYTVTIEPNLKKLNPNEKNDSEKIDFNSFTNFEYDLDYLTSNSTKEYYYSGEDSNKSRNGKQRNFTLVITFCAIALFIVLVNLRVFQIVIRDTQKRNRPVNILVAHLSFLTICWIFVFSIYVMEKSNIFSLTAPGLCEFLSPLRNTVISIFPLNSAAITYVQTRNNISNTFLFIGLCVIWTIAVVGSSPSIFMVTYVKDRYIGLEICKQIHLLGTVEATIAYEVFRFLVYHFLVCFYMAYAMITIRSRIRYLYINKPIPEKMKRRVQRVRFVYLHSIIFILIWFPTGFGFALYKLQTRVDWMDGYMGIYQTAVITLSSLLFILSPLVYVILHEKTSAIFCTGLGNVTKCKINELSAKQADSESSCMKGKRMTSKNGKEKARMARKIMKRKIRKEATGDMSRISTVAISGTSSKSVILYKQIILQSWTKLAALREPKITVIRTCVDVSERKKGVGVHGKLCKRYAKETMI